MQPSPPKGSRHSPAEESTSGSVLSTSESGAAGGGRSAKKFNRGPKKQTAKELLAERARIDAAMEQVEAAKAKARAQRAEYGRYLEWKVALQRKERESREQEDIAMRNRVEEKLREVLKQHREQAREDRNQWKKFTTNKVRKQEPLWLANGLEDERKFAAEQSERRKRHIEESTMAFRNTLAPKSAPAGGKSHASIRRPIPHHISSMDSNTDGAGAADATVPALDGVDMLTLGTKKTGLEYFTDPQELNDPHRQLRKSGDWVEQRRAADARLYFYNKKTKVKTWDVMETPFATMPFIDPNAIDLSQATDEESLRQLRDRKLRDPNRPLRKVARWMEKRRPNDGALYFLNWENKTATVKVDDTPFGKMGFEDYTAEESIRELEKEQKEKIKFKDLNRPLRTHTNWTEERDEDGAIIFVNAETKKVTKNVDETPFAFMSLDEGVKKLTQAEKIMAQSRATGALDLNQLWNMTTLPPVQHCNYVSEEEMLERRMNDKSTPAAIRAARLQKSSKRHFAAVTDMYEKARTRRLYATGRMLADPPADYMLGTDILRYIPAEVLNDEPQDEMGLIGAGPAPADGGPSDTVFLTQDVNDQPRSPHKIKGPAGASAPAGISPVKDSDLADLDPATSSVPVGPGGTKGLKWKKWDPNAWMGLPKPNSLSLKEHREPEEEKATLTWYKNYHEQYTKVKKRTEHHGKNYSWKKAERFDLPPAKNIMHDKD